MFQDGAFRVTVHQDGSRARIALRGEFDIAAEKQFRREMSTGLEAGPSDLVIDLRELSFLDSTGLRALIRVREECEAGGCNLWLIRGAPTVQRVFEITGVAAHFALVDGDPAPA